MRRCHSALFLSYLDTIFLKELALDNCKLGDKGVRLIADALVGNMTMEVLNISWNFPSNSLSALVRLLESTKIRTINLEGNKGLFKNSAAMKHFVSTLLHKNSSLEKLLGIEVIGEDPSMDYDMRLVQFSLARNQCLNHVSGLLNTPQPQQPSRSNSGTMLIKIWHKAITKFAMHGPRFSIAGASAIFKLFRERPALLEKRLRRPASTAAVAAPSSKISRHAETDNHDGGSTNSVKASAIGGQKRQASVDAADAVSHDSRHVDIGNHAKSNKCVELAADTSKHKHRRL